MTDGRYSFKVKAVNVIGSSDLSDKFTIVAAVLPDAPGVPAKHQASVSSMEIRWSAPVSDGGSAILDYNVYWDRGQGIDSFYLIGTTEGYLTFTVTPAISAFYIGGEWYKFRVTAVTSVGEGDYSESVAILAAEIPDAPSKPVLVVQEPTFITIQWTANYDGGSPIRDYEVYFDNAGQTIFYALAPTTGSASI